MNNIENYMGLISYGTYLLMTIFCFDYMDLAFETFHISKKNKLSKLLAGIFEVISKNLYTLTRARSVNTDPITFISLIIYTMTTLLVGYFVCIENLFTSNITYVFSLYFIITSLLRENIHRQTQNTFGYDYKILNNLIYLFIPIIMVNISVFKNVDHKFELVQIVMAYLISVFSFLKLYSSTEIKLSHQKSDSIFDRLYFVVYILILTRMFMNNMKVSFEYEALLSGVVAFTTYLLFKLYKFNTLRSSHRESNKVAKELLALSLFFSMVKGVWLWS